MYIVYMIILYNMSRQYLEKRCNYAIQIIIYCNEKFTSLEQQNSPPSSFALPDDGGEGRFVLRLCTSDRSDAVGAIVAKYGQQDRVLVSLKT